MSRHRSRHRAVQVLYQCDVRQVRPDQAISDFYGSLYSEESENEIGKDEFMEELVDGVNRNRQEIDKLLQNASENWRVERMPAVDRNILRLASYELLAGHLPAPVVIDEALELARRFSGDESVSFVNGVLEGVKRQLAATP